MWFDFCIGLLIGIFLLFIPGTLAAITLRRPLTHSIACAPAISVGLYSIIAVFFGILGIDCSWLSVSLPLIALLLCFFAISIVVRNRKLSESSYPDLIRSPRHEEVMLAAYLVFGIVVTFWVFVRCLDGPGSFFQEVDNVAHLASLRTFSESNDWSCLSGGSFYPSAWYMIGAMIMSAISVEPTVAANITDTLFISCAFPAGMYFLLYKTISNNKAARWIGAIGCMAFASFPWVLEIWGPLHPFLAGLCLFPSVAATFIAITDGTAQGKTRLFLASLLAIEGIGIVNAHTSAVFGLIAFLTPYCCARIFNLESLAQKKGLRITLSAAFAILVVILWGILFTSPALKGPTSFNWPAITTPVDAFFDFLLLNLKGASPQPVLGVLVILGIIYLIKSKQNRWLIVSYIIVCAMYVFDAGTEGFFKHFLTGFWFSDQTRTAAFVALFAMPLAFVGASWLLSLTNKAFNRLHLKKNAQPSSILHLALLLVLTVALFTPVVVLPGVGKVNTAFGALEARITSEHSTSLNHYFNQDEQRFVEEVSHLIPEGETVIVIPADGSAFAYGVNGVTTTARGMMDLPNSDTAMGIVRLHLNEISNNDEVRKAVQDLNTKYVLQLDYGKDLFPDYYSTYQNDDWIGISSITEKTPGFKLLKQEGDMRLYMITD